MKLKKWALNLDSLVLIPVIKFEYKSNYLYFEAENWRKADEFVCSLLNKSKLDNYISEEFSHKKPILPEIDKIIKEIIYN